MRCERSILMSRSICKASLIIFDRAAGELEFGCSSMPVIRMLPRLILQVLRVTTCFEDWSSKTGLSGDSSIHRNWSSKTAMSTIRLSCPECPHSYARFRCGLRLCCLRCPAALPLVPTLGCSNPPLLSSSLIIMEISSLMDDMTSALNLSAAILELSVWVGEGGSGLPGVSVGCLVFRAGRGALGQNLYLFNFSAMQAAIASLLGR